MNDYEERKQARIDRYRELAEKNRCKADTLYDESGAAVAGIPFGQPILVGHHSEKRHRNALERSHRKMGQSIEAQKKAEYYEAKAASAESNRAISSDDPEAVTKLREKIAGAEELQARMKAVNAAHRKYRKDPASLDTAELTDREKELIRSYEPRYSWEPHPIAPYQLQNNNANIRRMKQRLADLEAQQGRQTAEYEIGGVRVVENVEVNRLQIFFDAKPAPEVRQRLKARGFRWARSIGAWQRQLNTLGENARYWAGRALEEES